MRKERCPNQEFSWVQARTLHSAYAVCSSHRILPSLLPFAVTQKLPVLVCAALNSLFLITFKRFFSVLLFSAWGDVDVFEVFNVLETGGVWWWGVLPEFISPSWYGMEFPKALWPLISSDAVALVACLLLKWQASSKMSCQVWGFGVQNLAWGKFSEYRCVAETQKAPAFQQHSGQVSMGALPLVDQHYPLCRSPFKRKAVSQGVLLFFIG